MTLDFVSLVHAGDNPEAEIVISKAAPIQKEDSMGIKDGLSQEVLDYIESLETVNKELTDEVDSLTETVEKLEKDSLVSKSEDELQKELLEKADPAVRALIEKQEAKLKEASEIAKAERDARLDREFLSKAEAMPMLSTEKTALGGLLRRISDALSAEDVAEVEKILRSANDHIAKSNLFNEFGMGGSETTVSKSVDGMAQEIIKANPDLTIDQAREKVYQNNPDLFAQAMNEEG